MSRESQEYCKRSGKVQSSDRYRRTRLTFRRLPAAQSAGQGCQDTDGRILPIVGHISEILLKREDHLDVAERVPTKFGETQAMVDIIAGEDHRNRFHQRGRRSRGRRAPVPSHRLIVGFARRQTRDLANFRHEDDGGRNRKILRQ